MSLRMLSSKYYANFILDGLKVAEGISYLDRKQLHNNNIKHGCVVINVTNVFNEYIQFLHASKGVYTMPKGFLY